MVYGFILHQDRMGIPSDIEQTCTYIHIREVLGNAIMYMARG